jgi:hypothetical protein
MSNTNLEMYRDLLPIVIHRLSNEDARAAQAIADAVRLGAPVNIVQLTAAARIVKENRITLREQLLLVATEATARLAEEEQPNQDTAALQETVARSFKYLDYLN